MARVAELLLPPLPPLDFGLLQAVCCGSRDILEMLLNAATPEELPGLLAAPSDACGRSALHFAAAAGELGPRREWRVFCACGARGLRVRS